MGRPLPVLSRSAVIQAVPPRPRAFGRTAVPHLRDAQGRRYTYLRLSVTDRCDLACVYCMPPSGEEDHAVRRELLSFEEAARIVGVFARAGIRRVRLTGGEPLVRKDAVRMVELIHRRNEDLELVMTSNATRLPELAAALRRAGLSAVNVSLDSLDPERFRRVTRGGDLGRVLAGIHAARDAGMDLKLNTVALGGVNEDELGRIVDFAWDHGITPRFIELMPLGEAAHLPSHAFLPVDRIVELLGDRIERLTPSGVPGHGPARYLPAANGSGRRVGFITAVTETFCDTCNRVRVTARGDLRACLAHRQAVSLRDILRGGGSDLDLSWALAWALSGKGDGHAFLDPAEDEHHHVGMSLIGG